MGKLLEKLPIINVWDWSDGNKYTTEENTTILTPELAESDQRIEAEAEKHFSTPSKGNAGKGMQQIKVDKDKLNKERIDKQSQQAKEKRKGSKGMEIGE